MARRIRQFSPGSFWFVTDRCFQEQFLLRPDHEANVLMLTLIRSALGLFVGEVDCFAFEMMGNHWHFVVRVSSPDVLPRFMQFLKSQLASRVNGLRERHGTFWSARYSAIPILDEEALLERIRYTLMNAVAAGIAAKCVEYVGLSSLEHSTGLRAACGPVDLPLALPPSWEGLDAQQLGLARAAMRAELEAQEQAVKANRIADGLPRPKPEHCRRMSPFDRPADPARRPRPECFASTLAARRSHRAEMRELRNGYTTASHSYRAGDMTVMFPYGTFPPRLERPFVEAPG